VLYFGTVNWENEKCEGVPNRISARIANGACNLAGDLVKKSPLWEVISCVGDKVMHKRCNDSKCETCEEVMVDKEDECKGQGGRGRRTFCFNPKMFSGDVSGITSVNGANIAAVSTVFGMFMAMAALLV
jgi:hypothetical protein